MCGFQDVPSAQEKMVLAEWVSSLGCNAGCCNTCHGRHYQSCWVTVTVCDHGEVWDVSI